MEEELCTVLDFPQSRDSQVYLSCTACFSVFLWFDPWCPPFPDQASQSVFRDLNGSSSNKMRVLLNFVHSCLPSIPGTASLVSYPYYLFDILVRLFSYCCPTLVVRWTVLLPKTLYRWAGLYYQRWVCLFHKVRCCSWFFCAIFMDDETVVAPQYLECLDFIDFTWN